MKQRMFITTDMECDDMNSLIHLCLYLNEVDLEGVIYTSSQFHFNGDGIHTQGEIQPDYLCAGEAAWKRNPRLPGPDPDAAKLKSYRPFETGWIEHLWQNEYAQCLPYLRENASGYPTVEELMKITCYGNTAFEGDVSQETDGSRLIAAAIKKDDERPLYLCSWGGANTIVRALMRIANTYQGTDKWAEIQQYVTDKVRIFGIMDGVGQDKTWLKYGRPLFPKLKLLRSEDIYGSYFASKNAPADCRYMFNPEWLNKYIKHCGSPLGEKYGLMGDGIYYKGEPDDYQFGLHPYIDWHFPQLPPVPFEKDEFLGEGDSNTYIPLLNTGLRGLEDGSYGTLIGRLYQDGTKLNKTDDIYSGEAGCDSSFIKAYQEEFAVRMQWTHMHKDQCTHAPAVKLEQDDFTAKPGETISLFAVVQDPDGRGLHYGWRLYHAGTTYHGTMKELRVFDPLSLHTCFTIPEDAVKDDQFIFLLVVRNDTGLPITRYGEAVIHII